MDGNRRWAASRGMSPSLGHAEGVKAIERAIKAATDAGVKILTLYAFSTENWKRGRVEINILFKLMERYLDTECRRLADNGIKLSTLGKIEEFPLRLREKIDRVKELTKGNSRLILNLALNYGARNEIVSAAVRMAADIKDGRLEAGQVSEELFSGYLCTAGLPDPELLIRTGGEMRLSNFLLWQASYSEIYVTKTLWPDFKKADFKKAVAAYQKRKRRLGQ
jgi:undecaprenyl diphosphate synthase